MTGYLAAYDPAQVTPAGDYWVWRSPRLDRRTLEDHHARIEAEHPFDAVIQTGHNAPCGGCLAVGPDWCCVYRYFAGGRDCRGRPGRYVLVCCFIPRLESSACNPAALLRQGPYSSIDADALSHGAKLPRREPAELDVELSTSAVIEVESIRAWRGDVEAGRSFHWIIGRDSEGGASEFRPILSAQYPAGRSEAGTSPADNPRRIVGPINKNRGPTRLFSKVVAFATYLSLATVVLLAGMFYESRTSHIRNWFAKAEFKRPLDEPALRNFLDTYRNADGLPYINTKTLLDRLDLGDWSMEQRVPPAPPSSGTRHRPDFGRSTPGRSAPSSR